MKKLTKSIASTTFLGLVLGSFVGLTHAAIIPGQVGPQPMDHALIETGVDGSCAAWYEYPLAGNSVISNYGQKDSTRVKVRINKNMVKASCKFTDGSGVYESDAEVGPISNCTLMTDLGVYSGGTGRVTAAANNGESDGGNVTIQCTFDPDTFVAHP